MEREGTLEQSTHDPHSRPTTIGFTPPAVEPRVESNKDTISDMPERVVPPYANAMNRLVVAVVLACGVPGCTLVSMGVSASVIGIHNGIADDENHWNYGTPLLVSALLGLVIDFLLLKEGASMWSKPMT